MPQPDATPEPPAASSFASQFTSLGGVALVSAMLTIFAPTVVGEILGGSAGAWAALGIAFKGMAGQAMGVLVALIPVVLLSPLPSAIVFTGSGTLPEVRAARNLLSAFVSLTILVASFAATAVSLDAGMSGTSVGVPVAAWLIVLLQILAASAMSRLPLGSASVRLEELRQSKIDALASRDNVVRHAVCRVSTAWWTLGVWGLLLMGAIPVLVGFFFHLAGGGRWEAVQIGALTVGLGALVVFSAGLVTSSLATRGVVARVSAIMGWCMAVVPYLLIGTIFATSAVANSLPIQLIIWSQWGMGIVAVVAISPSWARRIPTPVSSFCTILERDMRKSIHSREESIRVLENLSPPPWWRRTLFRPSGVETRRAPEVVSSEVSRESSRGPAR